MNFSSPSLVNGLAIAAVLYSSTYYVSAQGDATDALNWAATISEAQYCVKSCGEEFNDAGDNSLLMDCITNRDVDDGISLDKEFEKCCRMEDIPGCEYSLTAASNLLTTSLAGIQSAATNYLHCVYIHHNSKDVDCNMGNVCVGILTGGTGSLLPNDFDVGTNDQNGDSLAILARGADTCDSMDDFGYNACDQVKGCCSYCAPLIADVVHHVMNDLLLPAYSDTVSDCPAKTCDAYGVIQNRPPVRSLGDEEEEPATTTVDGTTTDTPTINGEDNIANTLATRCTNDMMTNIVQYNETYASENFFGCLTRKLGKVAADNDAMTATTQSTTGTSSATTVVTVASSVAAVAAATIAAIVA